MKLAYSTLACPNWTVEQAAQAARQYGYDGIEWRLADGEILSPQTPSSVKKRVVQATHNQHLEVACLDTGCQFVQPTAEARQQVVKDARAMADLAAELGAPYLRVFGGPIPATMSRAALLTPIAAALHEAADYATSQGVTILLETHDDWAKSQDALDLVTQAYPDPTRTILWDVHHPYRMGETPQQTFQTLLNGKAVGHVHIKDARRDSSDPQKWLLCLLEQGEVPVKEIVHLLNQSGYNGYLSLEWEKKWHPEIEEPEVALPQFADLLRGYLAEL